MNRVHVVASGSVQGVFFRAATQEEAHRLGVTGWVRNTPAGSVEAEFQGPPDVVERMLAFCRRGPGASVVEDLRVHEIKPVSGETTFEVTR